MPYIPLHDRLGPGPLPLGPTYAPPDLDPSRPAMSDSDSPRPAKRRRDDEGSSATRASTSSRTNGSQSNPSRASGSGSGGRYQPAPPPPQIGYDTPIAPSIFGIAPRNEFTKTIGEFIMAHCRGVPDVEIEIKLGTLHAPNDGGPPRRVRLPTMSEMILPTDYPKGSFASTMSQKQHASLNRLLNETVEQSRATPLPLFYKRVKQVDSFYNGRSGKVRVSRDREGNVVPGGVIRKRRLGDLNIVSPREAFDWRVSCNVEEQVEMPDGEPLSVRDKDRMCYEHQLCQVDLTFVTAKDRNLAPGQRGAMSYELEIEVRDVHSLVEEGEKEMAGQPNRFDEMLQSVLDTARMLIRNVEG